MIPVPSIAESKNPTRTVPDKWATFIDRLMRIDQFVNLVDENFEGSDFNQGTFIQRQLVRRDHVDTLITSRVRAEESQRRFLTAIGASVLIRSRRTLSQQMGAHATLVHSNGIIGADGNGT